MRAAICLAGVAWLAAGTEEFGNAPVPANGEWAAGVRAVANDVHRVYTRWINGNEEFFFCGDAAAANAALALFAKVEAPEKIVVLLPGRGLTHSFEEKPVAHDWRLHAPSGLYLGMAQLKGAPGVLAVQASLELRIHDGLPAAKLAIPAGVRVLGPTGLADRYRQGLEHDDKDVRGQAALALGRLIWVPGVVETLIGQLSDRDVYVRQCAARALVYAGPGPAVRAIERCRDRAEGQERRYLEQQLGALRAAAEAEEEPRVDPEARARDVESIRELVEKQRGPRKVRRAAAEAEQRELDKVSAVVRGQCIDGATGEPKAGCVVEVRALGRRRNVDVDESLLKPPPVTTGADGRFAVRVFASEGCQVGLDITCEDCWPRTGRWRHLVPGVVEDLGEIPLHRGVHAVGRVVDTEGTPVPNVSVGINELPLYVGAEKDAGDTRSLPERLRANTDSGTRALHLHANNVRYGRTGGDGAFDSRDALPPGTFALRINGRGLTLVEPQTITIPATGPMAPVTIVVEQQPFLAGRVIDDMGAPVPGVMLSAALQRSGRMASASTGRDGSFRIYRVEDTPDRVRIRVDDPGPCELPPATAEFAWGKHDIVIALKRALTVDVLVLAADTGEPIEDFAIRGYPIAGSTNSSLDQRTRLSGQHPEGVLTVDRVRRGSNRITIIPTDPLLMPVSIDVEGVESDDAPEPVRIEVPRLVKKMVRVLDAQDLPATNIEVQVIVPGNFAHAADRDVINDVRRDGMSAYSSDPDATFDTRIYAARTDGGGTCIVYGIAGRDDLVLGVRVEGQRRLHRVTDVAFGAKHASQEIRLAK